MSKTKLFKKAKPYDIITTVILSILAVIIVFPFYNVVIVSFADYADIAKRGLYLLPTSFDLSAYNKVVSDAKFWNAFGVTSFITVCGVVLSMTVTVLGSYALAKKDLPFRKAIFTFVIFTMFFSGGLIPYYLQIKRLGLINSIFVMIIPTCVSTYYLIIMKNYFTNAPISLIEAARIDGAGDIFILFHIILPISKPFMATFALFYAVDRWNEWWNAMMFINKTNLQPLQIYLRNMLITFNSDLSSAASSAIQSQQDRNIYFPSLQMAAVVIASIPILMAYPYLQKHFTRGIMAGSIKE